jgi:arsenite methyltransferase
MTNDTDLREDVRQRYAEAATTVTAGAGAACDCCHPGATCAEEGHAFGPALYDALADEGLPEAAVLASLGCGNPTAVADLHPGETVLDLGSGGGIDVLLSAKRVGPTGKVYGLDMTEEMLALAIKNREEAGATNVEFLKGYIEEVPLPANTVDVVISNCVINLSTDKPRVFAEMHRVLRPGGRIGISDVLADNDLTPAQRAERGTYVGCIAGALSFEEYEAGLRAAGLEDVSITSTHESAPGMHSAIVKATKSSAAGEAAAVIARAGRELPVVQKSCC